MHELVSNPLWRPDDLGRAIPDSPHAVSVCLPRWEDNVGYEENDPRVHDRISTGYPRFVYNALCQRLFDECAVRFARDGETCQAYPTAASAERCVNFLPRAAGASIHRLGIDDVHAVRFPRVHAKTAKEFWQHTGEGISSRQAAACFAAVCETGGPADGGATSEQPASAEEGSRAIEILRRRTADGAGVASENVFLYSCGMSAAFAVFRAATAMLPGRRTVQFGFPYVDTLKLQEKWGDGAAFYHRGDADDLREFESRLEAHPPAALFTEFPSNPLLASPDLDALGRLAKRNGFPLVVDDTLSTTVNTDLLPAADVIFTSLTKYFSGVGDVTGGAVVVNPASPFHADLTQRLRADGDGAVWAGDAVVLERNSRDWQERMRSINSTAETLARHLQNRPEVRTVYYPKFQTRDHYDRFRRADGGWGGLLSLVLEDPDAATPRFFDALRVSKGPNLGMNYSLACPYTIIAHYEELEFAEACGASRWLVRASVGLEDPDDLIERFDEALSLSHISHRR